MEYEKNPSDGGIYLLGAVVFARVVEQAHGYQDFAFTALSPWQYLVKR